MTFHACAHPMNICLVRYYQEYSFGQIFPGMFVGQILLGIFVGQILPGIFEEEADEGGISATNLVLIV